MWYSPEGQNYFHKIISHDYIYVSFHGYLKSVNGQFVVIAKTLNLLTVEKLMRIAIISKMSWKLIKENSTDPDERVEIGGSAEQFCMLFWHQH